MKILKKLRKIPLLFKRNPKLSISEKRALVTDLMKTIIKRDFNKRNVFIETKNLYYAVEIKYEFEDMIIIILNNRTKFTIFLNKNKKTFRIFDKNIQKNITVFLQKNYLKITDN
jgi:chloramphenicol O-acetyltransferase